MNANMIIETLSYPRAALIGNPSDGYFGKTIAFIFRNFSAHVQLYQTPKLEIKPEKLDLPVYDSISDLAEGIRLNGYYGGVRLIKASIKSFYRYCQNNHLELDDRNFTICYRSNIPLRLGLAGSSAIITATMRALMQFFNVTIPNPILANLILSVETVQLGLSAGLQDRVAQVYEHPVFMDFDQQLMETQGYGNYTSLDASLFPPIYIAFRSDQSQGSEVIHNNLRARFDIGEKNVHHAMKEWADLTVDFKEALLQQDHLKIHKLINQNYNIREDLIAVTDENRDMVRLARSTGASAKFTGSGGAIIGTYENDDQFEALQKIFADKEIDVNKPEIVNNRLN
jgi:glucuronokinase